MQKSLLHPKKWSFLAKHFPGRTQHNIKNRFHLVLRKHFESTKKARKDVKEEKILGVTKTVLEELELRRKMIQVDQMTEKPEKEDSIFGESFDLAVECLFGNNRST